MSGGVCPMTGKTCHTQEGAREARRQLRAQARTNAGKRLITVYVCPFVECHHRNAGRYHVGHTPFELRNSTRRRRRRFS